MDPLGEETWLSAATAFCFILEDKDPNFQAITSTPYVKFFSFKKPHESGPAYRLPNEKGD
jgi:hypothetical protein